MQTGYTEVLIAASPALLRDAAAVLAHDPAYAGDVADLRATADALEAQGRSTRLNPPPRVTYRDPGGK